MKPLRAINFYLTEPIYEELTKEHEWAKRVHNLHGKPTYLRLFLPLLYSKTFAPEAYRNYNRVSPNPNGSDPLLTEDQVILLIQSSSLMDLPALTYLAASLHHENKQNKL